MKVRVKQAHKSPTKDGQWVNHPLGQELEIDQKEFADNLHAPLKAEKSDNPKSKEE